MRVKGKIAFNVAEVGLVRADHIIMLIDTYSDNYNKREYSFTINGILTETEYKSIVKAALDHKGSVA